MNSRTLENVSVTTYPLQPSVCPGCGKCNTCGRPYEVQTPQPNATYSWPQWTHTQAGISGTSPNGVASCGLSDGYNYGLIGDSGIAYLNSVDDYDGVDA